MYENRSRDLWRKYWLFILADLIGYQISFISAFFIRNGLYNPYGTEEYIRLALMLAVAGCVVSWAANGYRNIMSRGMLAEFRSVAGYNSIVMILMIVMLFLVKASAVYSRIILGLTWLIGMVLLTVIRIMAKHLAASLARRNPSTRQLLVFTTESKVKRMEARIAAYEKTDCQVVGLVLMDRERADEKSCGDVPIVAGSADVLDYMNSRVIDGIFVEESACSLFTEQIADICIGMGITVHMEIHNLYRTKNHIVERMGDTVVVTSSMKIVNPRQTAIKRMMDIIGGLIGSAVAIVLLLLVAPVIKIQSPGPIIFKQTRIGRSGRLFTIYKIRTMFVGAESEKEALAGQNKMKGLMFKVDDDPRIYPFGHFLRRTSLDEFPQFFNVLIGNMSLVGTRPPTVDEYEQYEYKHKKRLSIKPGITGLWQVSGRSKITDFDEIVRLDAEYITSWRILLDIKILLKTVGVVLKGGGAQ